METGNDLRNNLEIVRNRINKAALRSGRDPDTIKLIAVTKNVLPDRVNHAIAMGVTDIGENRVQEMLEKQNLVENKCNWHMIGHLQRNKVRQVIDKVSLIHSLDSIPLAEELDKRAARAGISISVLVQVNVAGEESKFGLDKNEVRDFIKNISVLTNISTRGLMTIAPYTENPEESRQVFRSLKRLAIDIEGENIDNIYMDFLSMGMSNDFEVAIEEGANMVRVGSAIFGRRK